MANYNAIAKTVGALATGIVALALNSGCTTTSIPAYERDIKYRSTEVHPGIYFNPGTRRFYEDKHESEMNNFRRRQKALDRR